MLALRLGAMIAVFASTAAASDLPRAFTPSPEFQEWITNLVRQQLPEDYEKRKNWGHTAKSFDGVSIKFEDGRIKTHRKYKQANDGQWQVYRIKLTDPEEKFDIQIANIRKLPDAKIGLEVTAVASLEVFGRQSQWQHGVQLYSLSAEATARVRLWASADVATHMDLTRFPPDIFLAPTITAARFEVPDFRIRRIGEFHGPLVRSLSHATREALEDKLAEDNEKLVAKLNRAIDKQEKKTEALAGRRAEEPVARATRRRNRLLFGVTRRSLSSSCSYSCPCSQVVRGSPDPAPA